MVQSDRHTINVHFLPYCDNLLKELDAAPRFGALFRQIFTSNPLRAISVLKAVYFGITSPAQFRLFGHGKNSKLATATLLRLANNGKELSEEEKKELGTSGASADDARRVEVAVHNSQKGV